MNIMPKVIYDELQYPSLSPTTMLVQLVDSTIQYPKGIAEHVFVKSARLLRPCRFCGNGYGGRPWSRPRTWATFPKIRQGKDRCRKGRNPLLRRKGGYVFQVQEKGGATLHDSIRQRRASTLGCTGTLAKTPTLHT